MGKRIFGVGDPAIWQSDGTESIGALMERERVYFEKGDHARINGKMQVHHRLAFDEDGRPMLYVFDTCKHFIRTVPNLVYSETDVEDVDTDGEDHCLIGDTLAVLSDTKLQLLGPHGINRVKGPGKARHIFLGQSRNQVQMDMDIVLRVDAHHRMPQPF